MCFFSEKVKGGFMRDGACIIHCLDDEFVLNQDQSKVLDQTSTDPTWTISKPRHMTSPSTVQILVWYKFSV